MVTEQGSSRHHHDHGLCSNHTVCRVSQLTDRESINNRHRGWQQSTINGSSLLNWEGELNLNHDKHQLLIGFINAAPWLSGSLIGTWLSDPLQDHFGRRPALFIAAIFCVVLVIASIAPIFAAEAAPDKHRGQVLMLWQLFDTLGIFLGFVSALIVMDSWRVLLATATIPAIMLLFLVFLCPESPRYLIQKNKYADAYKSLLELRGTPVQAARDLYYIHSQLQTEAITKWDPPHSSEESFSWQRGDGYAYQQWIKRVNFFKRMRYLATDDRTRRACVVAFIVMASQQLCGINALTFYSSSLFTKDAFLNSKTVIKWYNFTNFLFTLPVLGFIDSRGRRPLLLVSFTGMLFSLIAISGFFKIADESTRGILIGVFSIVFFLFFYSVGAGPIPFTLSAEVFPLCVREVGMSFSVMVNFLGLGILVLFVPQLTSAFNGQANLLFFFSGLNLLGLVLIFLLVPETRQTKLEAMNSICKWLLVKLFKTWLFTRLRTNIFDS
ncbi:unnamed protein product [Penicillium olsonii]|nr:unnamed protein product [Penicillium olsonii]